MKDKIYAWWWKMFGGARVTPAGFALAYLALVACFIFALIPNKFHFG